MKCLLCKSNEIKIISVFAKKDLDLLWHNIYNINNIIDKENILLYQCSECKLSFFDPKLAGDDAFYSTLGELDWYYEHPGKTEYDFVQQFMKDGIKILDIGAGKGVLYSKTKAKIDYTGLDLSSRAVSDANELNINVINQTIQEHALTNKKKYDLVVSFQVLEHLTEIDSFLSAAIETLKPSGKLVIAVPNNESFISRHPNYTFNLPPHHIILWKKKQLELIPKLFKNIRLNTIKHELLQEVHRDYAFWSAKYWLISMLLGKKPRIIDQSAHHNRVLRFMKKIDSMVPKIIIKKLLKPLCKKGQSTIAVYEKIN